MKKSTKNGLLATATILGVIALQLPLTEVQVSRNRAQLNNMKGRVHAIGTFRQRTSRFPTHSELLELSQELPSRQGYVPEYFLNTFPQGDATAWELSYWDGDRTVTYISSKDYYSLSEDLSWRPFWGPLWWPLISAGILSMALFAIIIVFHMGQSRTTASTTTNEPAAGGSI